MGKAKRRYKITEVGVTYLKGDANQLVTYQSMLDQFFIMYSNLFELYIPSFKKDPIEKGTNDKRRNEIEYNDKKK
jgi:PadR family transcriptional regulator